MVYVKIPEPIMLSERQPDGARKPIRAITIVEVIDWITNDAYFSKPTSRGRVAAEMLADFERASTGDCVRLTSEQHGHIRAVLDNPSAPMNAMILKQIVPFLNALLEPLSEEQFNKEPTNGRSDTRQPAHS